MAAGRGNDDATQVYNNTSGSKTAEARPHVADWPARHAVVLGGKNLQANPQTEGALKMAFTCADVVTATLGQPKKQSEDEHYFLCPVHPDHDPSLLVNTRKTYGCEGLAPRAGLLGNHSRWRNPRYLRVRMPRHIKETIIFIR